ncbi:MAG: helix-turn-helix domain-containing protein [Ilumatobacteraceae bacterium]
MSETRRLRYDEGCLAANALNVVGDRWALLVVRELLLSPKRFQTIRAGLPGISPAVLSGRLDQLAADGVLVHHPTLRYYELTPLGHGLRPVLLELGRWGLAHPGHDPSRFISPTSLMLSMSIMIHPERAGRRRDTVGFDLGSECFSARLDGRGGFVVAATASAEGGVVLGGTGNELAAVVYGPTPVADHVAAGTVRVEGSVAAAQSFVELFSLHHDPAAP